MKPTLTEADTRKLFATIGAMTEVAFLLEHALDRHSGLLTTMRDIALPHATQSERAALDELAEALEGIARFRIGVAAMQRSMNALVNEGLD
jgi:hypothetical protein